MFSLLAPSSLSGHHSKSKTPSILIDFFSKRPIEGSSYTEI
jgi:hypothetical protein